MALSQNKPKSLKPVILPTQTTSKDFKSQQDEKKNLKLRSQFYNPQKSKNKNQQFIINVYKSIVAIVNFANIAFVVAHAGVLLQCVAVETTCLANFLSRFEVFTSSALQPKRYKQKTTATILRGLQGNDVSQSFK